MRETSFKSGYVRDGHVYMYKCVYVSVPSKIISINI